MENENVSGNECRFELKRVIVLVIWVKMRNLLFLLGSLTSGLCFFFFPFRFGSRVLFS